MSFQILNYSFANKDIKLSNANSLFNNNHCFTILTGKNGVGKSRLLVSIVSKYLKNKNSNELENIYEPNKIIAISNIKTDKFPIRRNESDRYYYFGNKSGFPNRGLDRFFIFKNLLINSDINKKSISQTFQYLGFTSIVGISFSATRSSYLNTSDQFDKYLEIFEIYYNFFKKTLSSIVFENFKMAFSIAMSHKADSYNKYSTEKIYAEEYTEYNRNGINRISSLPLSITDKIKKTLNRDDLLLLDCIYKLHSQGQKITLDIFDRIVSIFSKDIDYISRNNKFTYSFEDNNASFILEDFIFLLKMDIVRITNFELFSTNSKNPIRFIDLSSGQQSLFNILLGIAAVIEDNSLICIDEPEVNLHPEWQTEFIIKLQTIFDHVKGCHFIIATHSPQIVSGLKTDSGYVVDLENNILHSSVEYSKKSADYQLAKIFDAPGYNNEYIIKICLYLLSKIKDNTAFDKSDFINLSELHGFQSSLKTDDPVYYLVKEVISLSEV